MAAPGQNRGMSASYWVVVIRTYPAVSSRYESPPRTYPRGRCRRARHRQASPTNFTPSTSRGIVGAGRHDDVMKIALDSSTEVGARAGRVLLAEDSLTYLGLIRSTKPLNERRAGPVGDLSSYDAIVSDGATPPNDLVAQAAVRGIPLVLWNDAPGLHRGSSASPVAAGANVGSTLAPSLAHHPSANVGEEDDVTIAWTEPGKPLRKGRAIIFPDPVGEQWTQKRSRGRFVAYTEDEWAGAVVTIAGPSGVRIVGVADHASHLEAVTLAAATLAAIEGAYDSRIQDAVSRGAEVLMKAMSLELDFAVWRSAEHTPA